MEHDAPRSMREFIRLTPQMIATIPPSRWYFVQTAVARYRDGDWYGADLAWLMVQPFVPADLLTSTSQAESSAESSGHEGPASVVAEVPENPLVRASEAGETPTITAPQERCHATSR